MGGRSLILDVYGSDLDLVLADDIDRGTARELRAEASERQLKVAKLGGELAMKQL